MVVVKMFVLVLSLGIDTLMMSISLGVVRIQGKVKIALTFASAEAVMPLVGLFIGHGASHLIGRYADLMGAIALLAVAVWLIFFEDDDDDVFEHDEDGQDSDVPAGTVLQPRRQSPGEHELHHQPSSLAGWALLLTALSISLDELAVGFSIGLVGVPVALTISLVALQAFLFTWLGLTFGAKLKPLLGEWAEKIAGIVLGLLGVWMLIDALLHW